MWSSQLETGNQVLHLLPEVGEYTPQTRWMHKGSIKDKKEIFLRLFLRFIDPETIRRGLCLVACVLFVCLRALTARTISNACVSMRILMRECVCIHELKFGIVFDARVCRHARI